MRSFTMAFAEDVVRRWEERGFEKTAMATVGEALVFCCVGLSLGAGRSDAVVMGALVLRESLFGFLGEMRYIIAHKFGKPHNSLRIGLWRTLLSSIFGGHWACCCVVCRFSSRCRGLGGRVWEIVRRVSTVPPKVEWLWSVC